MQRQIRWMGLVAVAVTVLGVMAALLVLQTRSGEHAAVSPPTRAPDAAPTSTVSDEDAAFPTLPVGAQLPSGEECAQRVRAARLEREVRPENTAANQSTPTNLRLPPWPDFWAPPINRMFVPRIDGGFVGSTDEIIAWAACKWGIDANVVRAMAVSESSWRQSFVGDFSDDPSRCVGGSAAPCPTSFGLLQLKHTTRPGSWPYSQQFTGFNADYSLAVLRGCYEGHVTYLENGYSAGDLWGCAGWHYSGEWMDDDAIRYVEITQGHYRERPWLHW